MSIVDEKFVRHGLWLFGTDRLFNMFVHGLLSIGDYANSALSAFHTFPRFEHGDYSCNGAIDCGAIFKRSELFFTLLFPLYFKETLVAEE